MTIAEDEKFRNQDNKKYKIENNQEFIYWLIKSVNNGYNLYINFENIQDMINKISYWYEIKYPERTFENKEGIIHDNFKNIKNLAQEMNIKQLNYRLSHKQLCLMECEYRSVGGSSKPIYNEKGEIIDFKKFIYIPIVNKYDNTEILIKFTPLGEIELNNDLKTIINKKTITLNELLILLKKDYKNKFDYTKLEKCIYDHQCDINLRNKIFELVTLKLLYSNETIAEHGYERAKLFINEINENLNTNLNTTEIDEIVNKFPSFININNNNLIQTKKKKIINHNFKNN